MELGNHWHSLFTVTYRLCSIPLLKRENGKYLLLFPDFIFSIILYENTKLYFKIIILKMLKLVTKYGI